MITIIVDNFKMCSLITTIYNIKMDCIMNKLSYSAHQSKCNYYDNETLNFFGS